MSGRAHLGLLGPPGPGGDRLPPEGVGIDGVARGRSDRVTVTSSARARGPGLGTMYTASARSPGCPPSPTHATLCLIVRGVTGKGTHMTQLHEVTADARTAGRALTTLPGPRGLPLVGNLLQLKVTQLQTILEQWADTYGPLYTFRLGRKPVVVLTTPDLIQAVLRQRPETFRRMDVIARVLEEVGAHGLFAAEGTAWRRQRRVVMPALSPPHGRQFFPILTAA